MKDIKYLAVLVCMAFASVSSFAQEKKLQTERDGFRWYELRQGDKRGAQSEGGVTFIPLSRGYTSIWYNDHDGGWFNVYKENSQGACDITGREIVAPGRYDYVDFHVDHDVSYCMVTLNGKRGMCDINGREILSPRYDIFVILDYEGYKYIIAKVNGKEGIYDINGREIVAPQAAVNCYKGVISYKDASGKWVSTGIKLSSLAQTPSTNPTPSPTPTPTPQPQPQPQPQPVRQPQPFQVWQACFMCGGSGQCRYCYGYGWAANGKDTCGICHGTGKCSQCAGHGGQNVIEYR